MTGTRPFFKNDRPVKIDLMDFQWKYPCFFLMEFQGIWVAYFEIPLMAENEFHQWILKTLINQYIYWFN